MDAGFAGRSVRPTEDVLVNKNYLDSWLGVIGNVAVVIGLVVVAIELRQNSVVANGELTTQFLTNWEEMDRSR